MESNIKVQNKIVYISLCIPTCETKVIIEDQSSNYYLDSATSISSPTSKSFWLFLKAGKV